MTLQKIMEKVKSVWSLALQVWQEPQHCFTLCYQTVQSFFDCLSVRFSKNRMTVPMCLICQRTSFNCGTVSAIILVCISFNFLNHNEVNISEKIKKNILVSIFSLLIGAILKPISWTWNIVKFLMNTSVDTFLLLITVTLQSSLIIGYFGILVISPLILMSQIIKSKLRNGMWKIKIGLRKIRTKCSIK